MKKHSAFQEYVTGVKQPVSKLSTGAIQLITIAVALGWIALALAGVVDFFISDAGIFKAEWQRIASWLAILFLVVVVVRNHVKRMRRKGRQILDQNS
jgi:hypothetical protein